MAISVSIPGVQRLDEGVLKAKLSPSEAGILGKGATTYGSISVVLLTEEPNFDKASSNLSFNPASVQVLNLGATDQAVFIVGSGTKKESIKDENISTLGTFSTGDTKFLHDLPPQLQAFGSDLLSEIRTHFPGELRYYPKSKKYVETPDNFWTIRIQSRDKSFRVTVRGRPDAFIKPNSLVVKPDMTGYSSFKVVRREQISELIGILKQVNRN